MQLIQPFNAQEFDPTQSTGGLPIGKHPVIIESSEVKATSKNDSGLLQLNLKIIDGPQTGTVGAYRLNLYNANQQAAEIAHKQLSAICHCVGVFMIQDSSQLHNIPFLIEVGPQKNDPQYTEVKKVFDRNGNEPGKAAGNQSAQPQGQGQGGFGGQQQMQQQAAPNSFGQGQQQQPQNGGFQQGGFPQQGQQDQGQQQQGGFNQGGMNQQQGNPGQAQQGGAQWAQSGQQPQQNQQQQQSPQQGQWAGQQGSGQQQGGASAPWGKQQ